jgi:hypothetical protein
MDFTMEVALRYKGDNIKYYSISAIGQVKCIAFPDIMIPSRISGTKKKKYIQVQLVYNRRLRWMYVHQLMAYSWHGDPPHVLRYICDHSDGDSLNNNVENLRWVTPRANQINKKCHGIVKTGGLYCPRIAGYVHKRYGNTDIDIVKLARMHLVECYVRYNSRFPTVDFPHHTIHKF